MGKIRGVLKKTHEPRPVGRLKKKVKFADQEDGKSSSSANLIANPDAPAAHSSGAKVTKPSIGDPQSSGGNAKKPNDPLPLSSGGNVTDLDAELAKQEVQTERQQDDIATGMAKEFDHTAFVVEPTPTHQRTHMTKLPVMETLDWSHKYEPLGRMIPNVQVIFCSGCHLPVKILGEPDPCSKHKYCLDCLLKTRTCLLCFPVPTTKKDDEKGTSMDPPVASGSKTKTTSKIRNHSSTSSSSSRESKKDAKKGKNMDASVAIGSKPKNAYKSRNHSSASISTSRRKK